MAKFVSKFVSNSPTPSEIALFYAVSEAITLIMDFGLARSYTAETRQLTKIGTPLGTPAYMSPEQMQGDAKSIGPATDIYALGVLLYELLTGSPPFDGPPAAICAQVLVTVPPPPSSRRPDLAAWIDDVCMKAMAKKPAERFGSMAEFAAALVPPTMAPRPAPPTAAALVSPTLMTYNAPPTAAPNPKAIALPVARIATQQAPTPARRQPAARETQPQNTPDRETIQPSSVPRRRVARPESSKGVTDPVESSTPFEDSGRATPRGLLIGGLLLAVGIAVGAMVLLNRGGKDDEKGDDPKPVAALRLDSIEPVTLTPGGSTTIAVRIARENCKGRVDLSLEGLPSDILGAPAVIAADDDRAGVRLDARVNAEAGAHTVRLVASCGDALAEQLVRIRIQPVKPPEAVLLLESVEDVSLVPGQTETIVIRITRKNFKGPVVLSVEGLPTGVTAKLGAIQADSDRGTVDLTADPTMTPTTRTASVVAVAKDARTQGNVHITVRRAELARDFENSIGMKLVLVPAGKFTMGSPNTEKERFDDEGPQREVEITNSYYLAIYEVTQDDYERVMKTNPSHFSATGAGKAKVAGMATGRFPVESVSWDDAKEFCRKLSALPAEKAAGRSCRLPTEAEWEYACRGGPSVKESAPFCFDRPTYSLSSTQANFDGNYPYASANKGDYLQRTRAVGFYRPNVLDLHDMHGNLWEWCEDYYGPYAGFSSKDPLRTVKIASEDRRVLRGGSWDGNARFCRAAFRNGNAPGFRGINIGFRVVCLPPRTP